MDEISTKRTGARIFWWTVLAGFLAIGLILNWEEHKAHFLGALPYLFLLACPLMHVFMHRDHGRHSDSVYRHNH